MLEYCELPTESLVHAVIETRMKEFVCDGYLSWESSLSSGDIKLVETDWAFPCNDAPCFISTLRKVLKSTGKKLHPEITGKTMLLTNLEMRLSPTAKEE